MNCTYRGTTFHGWESVVNTLGDRRGLPFWQTHCSNCKVGMIKKFPCSYINSESYNGQKMLGLERYQQIFSRGCNSVDQFVMTYEVDVNSNF